MTIDDEELKEKVQSGELKPGGMIIDFTTAKERIHELKMYEPKKQKKNAKPSNSQECWGEILESLNNHKCALVTQGKLVEIAPNEYIQIFKLQIVDMNRE